MGAIQISTESLTKLFFYSYRAITEVYKLAPFLFRLIFCGGANVCP